ncbi:HET-domain-containing protein [Cadophora sp. DSE1049]|nr:HET-domain-containing protein [Cadophora sp. DSE1049]
MVLAILKDVKPGWTDTGGTEKKISLRKGEIRLLEDDKIAGRFKLYERIDPSTPMVETSRDGFLPKFKIARSYRSKRAFHQAKEWLSNCLDEHPGCQSSDPDFVPHRLLDLSWKGFARLVNLTKPAPYVCLSYCWGSDLTDIVITVTDNLKAHYDKIRISSLPQTVQDAITVCEKLDLRYLWVDALCIIQRNEEDWKRESSQMAHIYKNCLFTIAAKEPDSCKKGFLGPQRYREHQLRRNLRIQVPAFLGGPVNGILVWTVPETVSKELSEDMALDRLFDSATMPKSVAECSLDTRGWCLQESILPNRILSFDGIEIAWECVQAYRCECDGHFHSKNNSGVLEDSQLKNRLERGFDPLYRIAVKPERDPLRAIRARRFDYHEKWAGLVEDYSKRNLTRGSDKLVAISGLAKLFLAASSLANNGIQDRYYAGLWERHFVLGLAWAVDLLMLQSTNRHQHTRYEDFCAPTWSWASIDGPVQYWRSSNEVKWKYGTVPKSYIEVKAINCVPGLASDHTGSITSAFAELTGPLVEVQLAILEAELKFRWYEDGDSGILGSRWESRRGLPMCKTPCLVRAKNLKTFEVILDIPMEPTLHRDHEQVNCWIGRGCERDCCHWESLTDGMSPRYFCLKLFSWEADPNRVIRRAVGLVDGKFEVLGKDKDPETWFLILKLSTTQPRAYERIGIGCSTSSRVPKMSFRLFEACTMETVHVI